MLWETADRQNCGHQKITCIEQKACLKSINIDGITKAFRDVFETGLKIHTNREYHHSKDGFDHDESSLLGLMK